MGNNIVGEMYHIAATTIDDKISELTQQEASDILKKITDIIKSCYHYSSDAEFGDYTSPKYPLGRLLIKVFRPEKYDEWTNMDWKFATDDQHEELGIVTYYKFKKMCKFN